MSFDVPLVDLSVVNGRGVKDEALQRIRSIATVGPFIDGPEVQQWEERWADYVGARYCVGVASGCDALELAVRGTFGPRTLGALRVPALTFVATAEAVVRAGVELVELVDVDPVTLLGHELDVAVGLYGQPVEDGALVVDAAQMHGIQTFGDTASWSFYPTKNLGAWGDAGAVTTDDEGLAEGIRDLARHGNNGRRGCGFTSRLDTVQAAVLIEKLNRLDEWVEARRQAAGSYRRRLRAMGLEVIGDERSVYHLVVTRVPNRDRVRVEMGLRGVETGIHYPLALSEMVWLDDWRADPQGSCHVAERAAGEVLSLPVWPGIPVSTIDRVVNALGESIEEAT